MLGRGPLGALPLGGFEAQEEAAAITATLSVTEADDTVASTAVLVAAEAPVVGSRITGSSFSRKKWRELLKQIEDEKPKKKKPLVAAAKKVEEAEEAILEATPLILPEEIYAAEQAMLSAFNAAQSAMSIAEAVRKAKEAQALAVRIIKYLEEEEEDEMLLLAA